MLFNKDQEYKKASYDYSSSNGSSVSSGSKYNNSSILSLSDQEGEKTPIREINNMDQVIITNTNYNKLNDVIENELKFDSSNSLANNPIKYPLPIVTIRLRGGKKSRQTYKSGLTWLWENGAINSIIKIKHINTYIYKLPANKAKYSTASGPYKTTHAVKVTFITPEFSIRKSYNTYISRWQRARKYRDRLWNYYRPWYDVTIRP